MEGSRLSKSNMTSPVKSEAYFSLQEDKKLILKKLHYLFISYTAKASRYAYRQMSEKCFMELVQHIFESAGRSLYKNSDSWKKIATLYHGKGKKTGMIFDQFLKLLPSISAQFCRSHDVEDDLKYLMKHLLEVYKKKVSQQIQSKYVEFDFNLKKETLEYIGKLADQLLIVYKLYFPQEMTNQSIIESFENVMLFFKQFEIYPKIISASQLYMVFLQIINSDFDNMFSWADQQRKKLGQKGSIFTFSKFVDTLVRVGIVGVSRLRQVQDPEWWVNRQKQSVKALFEYMENVKVKNKNCKYKQVRFTFILLEQYHSQGQKWLTVQTDRFQQHTKQQNFFQLFERMKL